MTPDQESKLIEIFQHSEHEKLTQWEKDRLIEWSAKYEEYGAEFFVSAKMWFVLERIEEKIYGR